MNTIQIKTAIPVNRENPFARKGEIFLINNIPYMLCAHGDPRTVMLLYNMTNGNRWSERNLYNLRVNEIIRAIGGDGEHANVVVKYIGHRAITIRIR